MPAIRGAPPSRLLDRGSSTGAPPTPNRSARGSGPATSGSRTRPSSPTRIPSPRGWNERRSSHDRRRGAMRSESSSSRMTTSGPRGSPPLFFLPLGRAGSTELSYTQFVNKVAANQVKSATIDPNGAVSGTLSNGADYTTQIPVALQDTNLTQQLQEHDVQIVGKKASSNLL